MSGKKQIFDSLEHLDWTANIAYRTNFVISRESWDAFGTRFTHLYATVIAKPEGFYVIISKKIEHTDRETQDKITQKLAILQDPEHDYIPDFEEVLNEIRDNAFDIEESGLKKLDERVVEENLEADELFRSNYGYLYHYMEKEDDNDE